MPWTRAYTLGTSPTKSGFLTSGAIPAGNTIMAVRATFTLWDQEVSESDTWNFPAAQTLVGISWAPRATDAEPEAFLYDPVADANNDAVWLAWEMAQFREVGTFFDFASTPQSAVVHAQATNTPPGWRFKGRRKIVAGGGVNFGFTQFAFNTVDGAPSGYSFIWKASLSTLYLPTKT
jgi:hypothetical protein